MFRRVLAPLALLLGFLGCQHEPPALLPPASTVVVEGSLANRFVRAGEGGIVTARVHVRAELPRSTSREPSNVALVVDSSGSMAGAPLEAARLAAGVVVDTLADGDWLSVVAFGSTAQVLLPATELDAEARVAAKTALGKLSAEGTTDLAGGLRVGLDEAQKHAGLGTISRIVLLGDGVPNAPETLPELAQRAADLGAPISALGFGLEYDETVMGALARRSGGTLHDIQEPADVARYFASEARRVKRVLAKSARIELRAGPGVQVTEVVGRERAGRGREVVIPLGDLAGDEDKDVVVRFSATAHRPGAPVEICDALLRWEDPLTGATQERRIFLGAEASDSPADLESGRNRDVEETVTLVDAAARTLGAIQSARQGSAEEARRDLELAADAVDARAKEAGSAALAAEAEAMRELAGSLPAVAPSPAPPAPAAARAVRAANERANDLF
jgi:Ca-activated chloride channel family protein